MKESKSLHGKRVCVFDDDEEILKMLGDILGQAGAEVRVFKSPLEGLEYLQKTGCDLVLTDIRMPELSGEDLISELKQTSVNEKTPVVVISGIVDQEREARLIDLGVTVVVCKPFRIEQFLDVISQKACMPRMKGNFTQKNVGCIVKATRDLLSHYLENQATVTKPRIKLVGQSPAPISALISFESTKITGSLALSFNNILLTELAEKIMGEVSPNVFSSEILEDVAGEVCNQLLGKIRSNFGVLGIEVELGLPQIRTGDHHFIVHKINSSVLEVPIITGSGEALIEFAMVKIEENLQPSEYLRIGGI